MQNLVMLPTVIMKLKFITPFQGKFSLFLHLGPFSEAYKEIRPEKLKGNSPQSKQSPRKSNALKEE